jgi:hypothetical protein
LCTASNEGEFKGYDGGTQTETERLLLEDASREESRLKR